MNIQMSLEDAKKVGYDSGHYAFHYDLKIESGIPIPKPMTFPKKSKRKPPASGQVLELVSQMKVGDSVFVIGDSKVARIIRVMRSLGFKTSSRRQYVEIDARSYLYGTQSYTEPAMRIWRTK